MRQVCGTETNDASQQPRAKRSSAIYAAVLAGLAAIAGAHEARALPPAGVPAAMPRSEGQHEVHRIAVFGVDNRKRLPKWLEGLRSSIGVIYNERTRTVCSAFCVADDVIATASHCVFRTKGESPPPPERFFFARPGTRHPSIRFAGAASRASGQQIVAGATGISTKPPIDAARDWALIKLQGPACRGKAIGVEPLTPDEIEREATAGKLFQVAFHRDFGRWTMAYSEPCAAGRRVGGREAGPAVTERDFIDPLNLVLHTCDTGGASSGSPLLVETVGGPRAVAINVGTFVQSRVIIEEGVVVRRSEASPVANTAVSAVAFARKLEHMRAASILTSAADLKALQGHLLAANLLDGPVDGRFEARLRTAIELYEAGQGLPVMGLPTRELLQALQRGAGGR